MAEAKPALGTRIGNVIKDFAPLSGVLGALLYGVLRLAYVFFYIRLRTSPEEVGYDYSRVLSESMPGAVELTVLVALVVGALHVLKDLAAHRALGHGHNPPPMRLRDLRRLVTRRLVKRSLIMSATIVSVGLWILAAWLSCWALHGQTVHNVRLIWAVPYLPVFGVQASIADVDWKDGDTGKQRPLSLPRRKCLMYLGEAHGTSVFYDVGSHESLRLPSGDIVVTLRAADYVPDFCLG